MKLRVLKKGQDRNPRKISKDANGANEIKR